MTNRTILVGLGEVEAGRTVGRRRAEGILEDSVVVEGCDYRHCARLGSRASLRKSLVWLDSRSIGSKFGQDPGLCR